MTLQSQSPNPAPGEPPLAVVTKSYAGATIEDAFDRFEEDRSQEIYQAVNILQRSERADGVLVRYEVRDFFTP